MAVKSVFDIKCFKDVKFWVKQSVLHYNIIYRNPKTFFKISFPPCASKSFGMYMCMGGEGGRCSAAQKPGA